MILTVLFISTSVNAQSRSFGGKGSNMIITPIVGFERVQKLEPSPHMKTRAVYGANFLYRLPITSLEVEYTRASDTSNDYVNTVAYKTEEDKIRAGLRGSFVAGQYLNWYLRGGAQGRKTKVTKTTATGESSGDSSSKVQPYAGTGFEFRLLQMLSLKADIIATYTPTDDPDLKDYEIQPTFGISFKF